MSAGWNAVQCLTSADTGVSAFAGVLDAHVAWAVQLVSAANIRSTFGACSTVAVTTLSNGMLACR